MMVMASTVLQCTGDEVEFEQVAPSAILDQCLRAGVHSYFHVNVPGKKRMQFCQAARGPFAAAGAGWLYLFLLFPVQRVPAT